ncbi:uncharacterized protein PADG_08735 [Paracoccidioides brasiliensis Pb18]|uniref:Uncharacterized protein n=1 Tax=Paracoccidioides brasiliensis (strain Pb18) TaxID=502780 RepID=C1GN96_PARBD|nr:uncharacterized protein PADG_08735 [Paracoccidioides brasiliensis Pb18]EEH47413.2 hypothetical protein PADG_08735 [Paracoccidioides brasiliensis Pb18]
MPFAFHYDSLASRKIRDESVPSPPGKLRFSTLTKPTFVSSTSPTLRSRRIAATAEYSMSLGGHEAERKQRAQGDSAHHRTL